MLLSISLIFILLSIVMVKLLLNLGCCCRYYFIWFSMNLFPVELVFKHQQYQFDYELCKLDHN